jgi:biopolymer transport protein ExbB/TolQ
MNTKWIPPIFEPFDPTMATLALIWLFTVSLCLHRVTRYLAHRRSWSQFVVWVNAAKTRGPRRLGRLRTPPTADAFYQAIAVDPGQQSRDDFHAQHLATARTPDAWTDRALDALSRIAPLVGFIGTLVGVVLAFQSLASAKGSPSLQSLAGPLSLAVITTIHGAACSALCIFARLLCPIEDFYAQADEQFDAAWEALGPMLHREVGRDDQLSPRPQSNPPARVVIADQPDREDCHGSHT